MALGTPSYLLGYPITVQITPQNVSSGGVFSNHSIGALTFQAVIEEDSFESALTTQNYTSVRSFNANPVPVEYEGTYIITEIMQALPVVTSSTWTWSRGNYLEACIGASWYHKIRVSAYNLDYVVGTAPTSGMLLRSWDFYALMTNLRRTSPKGKNTNAATFKLIAVSDGSSGFNANPTLGP